MSLPPHFIDAKKKEVVFHIKGGHPVTMRIDTWMKSFPAEYKGMIMTNTCLFKRLKDHS